MNALPETMWRQGLADGRLLLQRVLASGAVIFPPRLMEPGTGDEDWEWIEASGMGTIHAVTFIYPRPPAEPYNVVLVDLDEHVRLMSRIDDIAAEEVAIGQRVRAQIIEEDGQPLLVFRAT
jgi:uncharacterized OB-fold protein